MADMRYLARTFLDQTSGKTWRWPEDSTIIQVYNWIMEVWDDSYRKRERRKLLGQYGGDPVDIWMICDQVNKGLAGLAELICNQITEEREHGDRQSEMVCIGQELEQSQQSHIDNDVK